MKKIIVIIVLLTITFSIYGEQYATPINKLYGRRCTFEYRIGHENNCCFILIRAFKGKESVIEENDKLIIKTYNGEVTLLATKDIVDNNNDGFLRFPLKVKQIQQISTCVKYIQLYNNKKTSSLKFWDYNTINKSMHKQAQMILKKVSIEKIEEENEEENEQVTDKKLYPSWRD